MDTFFNQLHVAFSFLLNVDPAIYATLLGGAVGVSLLTQGAKKLFNLTNEKHVVAVLNLIALLASGLEYFISNSHLPPTILGINTLILTGIAQPLYVYAIKPLSTFINAVQMYKGEVLKKVNDIAVASNIQPTSAQTIPSIIASGDVPATTSVAPVAVTTTNTPPVVISTPQQAQALIDTLTPPVVPTAVAETPAQSQETRPTASF